MADISIVGDKELQRLLSFSERSMDAVQQMLAVLRESDREMKALAERARELEMRAYTDMLTGLLSRHGFDQEMVREEARAGRFGLSVAVACIDVRGLNAINQAHGQSAGDAVLRMVGSGLRTGTRSSDLVARYGADQFVVLLLGTGTSGARTFVERIRSVIRFAQLPDGTVTTIRLSAGVATRDEGGSIQAALEIAEQRLLMDRARD